MLSDPALVDGLVPARQPTESRYVLRLLRAGYVYVYLPELPAGFKSHWLVWRVMENGDIIPESNSNFDANPYVACSRNGHNKAGMKLLEIPKAHLLVGKTLWIAYSANLWNDTIMRRNGANPRAMRPFVIGGENANAFQPTVENLGKHVLECRLNQLSIDGQLHHDFPFCGLTAEHQSLAENLKRAAASHPSTQGKELALVLADPVGVTSELNALRVLRHEQTKADLARPENAHPMASLQMLDGLRQSVIDQAEAGKTEGVTEYMIQWKFETLMYKNGNPRRWPQGTTWELSPDPEIRRRHRHGVGQLVFPDQAEREARWVAWSVEQTWSKYRQYIDETAIATWKDNFEREMRRKHGEPQAKFEADWWAARKDSAFDRYFVLHFDPADGNSPRERHCAGATYAEEACLAMTPQPLADSPVVAEYLAELDRPLEEETAIVLRSIVANQQDLLTLFKEYATEERQDKLHDLGAGVFKELKANLGNVDIKYGWVAHIGFGASTLTLLQSWSAALGGAGALATVERTSLLRSALMVSETLAMARESAAKGTWLKTPVLVSIELTVQEARDLLSQRRTAMGNATGDTPSNQRIKQLGRQQGKIHLTLLSDNHQLAGLGSDPRAAVAVGAGSIALDARGRARLPSTIGTLAVTETQFTRLAAAQPTRIKLAADAAREFVQLGRGAGLSLEGHIGLLGMWINGWGLVSNLEKAKASGDFVDALNVIDSALGVLAGAAQVTESALGASLVNRVGETAARNAVPILGLRALAAGAGAASGFVVTVGQFVKAWRQGRDGQYLAAFFYGFSGGAFLGFTATSGVQFVGAFSEFMIARGSQAALWRIGAASAARIGARLAAATPLGLTGWGLIFLGAGLILEVIAFIVMPNKLQIHVRRTRFGTGSDKYSSLVEEIAGLEALIQDKPAPAPISISELGPMP